MAMRVRNAARSSDSVRRANFRSSFLFFVCFMSSRAAIKKGLVAGRKKFFSIERSVSVGSISMLSSFSLFRRRSSVGGVFAIMSLRSCRLPVTDSAKPTPPGIIALRAVALRLPAKPASVILSSSCYSSGLGE